MPPKKYGTQRQLSALPEGATLLGHFRFTFIGQGAQQVATKVSQADLHAEVSEALAERRCSAWPGPTPSSPSGGGEEMVSERTLSQTQLSRLNTQKGTYCMIDEEDRTEAVRVVFHLVESFSDTMGRLADQTDVRNSCFVFLCDTRRGMEEGVMSLLLQGLAEMRFNHSQVKQRGSLWRMPALRAVLLTHEEGPTAAGQRPPELQDVALAASFVDKLGEATSGSPVKGRRWADFGSADALYAAIEGLARELYWGNMRAGRMGTRQGTESFGLGLLRGDGRGSSRLCAVQ